MMRTLVVLLLSAVLLTACETPGPALPETNKSGTFTKNELCAFINARYRAYSRYCSKPFECDVTKLKTLEQCSLMQLQYAQCRQDLAAEEKNVIIYCTVSEHEKKK